MAHLERTGLTVYTKGIAWLSAALLMVGLFFDGPWRTRVHEPQPPVAERPTGFIKLPLAAQARVGSAEAEVLKVLAAMDRSDLQAAWDLGRSMVDAYPNFQLGHLLFADINRILAFEPSWLADGTEQSWQSQAARLQELRQEATLRIAGLDRLPPVNTMPSVVMAWPTRLKSMIVVDASLSRLYVIESRTDPGTGMRQFQVADHAYVSFGKNGLGKQQEGDGRTPLGVYRVQTKRSSDALPAFYGYGALTLNYPNALDRMEGRTGSGIWIHGSPPEQYARAPRASEGCVVAANVDMQRLYNHPYAVQMPVVIAERIEWVPAAHALRPLGEMPFASGDALLLRDPRSPATVHAELAAQGSGASTPSIRRQIWQQSTQGWLLLHDDSRGGSAASTASARGDVGELASSVPRSKVESVVKEVVHQWAQAWSEKDVSTYLSFYGSAFVPESGQSREKWETLRRQRIREKSRIQVAAKEIRIKEQGDLVEVEFTQDYSADQVKSRSRKQLVLKKQGAEWRIVRERVVG